MARVFDSGISQNTEKLISLHDMAAKHPTASRKEATTVRAPLGTRNLHPNIFTQFYIKNGA